MGPRIPNRGRLCALAVLAALAAALVLAPAALADALTPESGGSSNADEIDSLYKIVLYVAAVVFVGVQATLLYSVIRFRERKGIVPAQIRGNTNLEIGWTVGAFVILLVLSVFTFIKLPAIKDPPRSGPGGLEASASLYAVTGQPPPPGGTPLEIEVVGQQYVWRYVYPDGTFSYDTMVVPVDTTVVLKVRAVDVVHSWWIPRLGGKVDAVPGSTNDTWFKVPEAGVYDGQCAELCGRGHANMLARVRAVSVTEYEQWLADQQEAIDQANEAAVEQREELGLDEPGGGEGEAGGDAEAQG